MSNCEQRPDADDLPHTEWQCNGCGKLNSMHDAECQYCDYEDGADDMPCLSKSGHKWVVSDESENVCYCENCGCLEY
jgi:hypothetical protein